MPTHHPHSRHRSFEYLDAHLTDFGWRQARALGRHIRALGGAFRADAIIVSPLTRTLETAAGVFGGECWQQGDPQPPLMLEQVGTGDWRGGWLRVGACRGVAQLLLG